MSEKEIFTELNNLITSEEKRIQNSFSSEISSRIGLIHILRAIDVFWTVHIGFRQESNEVNEKSLEEAWQLLYFGINKAVYLFLDKSCNLPGFPLVKSVEDSEMWANSVLQHSGRLSICRQFMDMSLIQLGNFKKESDRIYRFTFDYSYPVGLESFERDDFNWNRRNIFQDQKEKINILKLKEGCIKRKISSLVTTWKTHYIRYKTDGEIDYFYEQLGRLKSQGMYGYDCFPGNSKFGELEFSLYVKAVNIIIGWSIKHVNYCIQLLLKNPEINIHDIICISKKIDDQ